MSRASWGPRLLLVALVAFLGAALAYPVALTVAEAFRSDAGGFTLHHVRSVFAEAPTRRGLANATWIACATTALATLIALPLAVVGARFAFAGKRLLSALLLLPLVLPPFVGAIGVRHLLGRAGALNAALGTDIDWLARGGPWAIVAMEAIALYPILYLNLVAALSNVDPTLEEAAEAAGASGWTRFRRITLPLVRPGLFAGATIVFVWSFTELGTPLMFEYYDVTSVQVFNGIREVEASHRPYALVVVMLLFSVGFYLLGKSTLGRATAASKGKASVARAEVRLTGAAQAGAIALFGGVALVASMPALAVGFASLSVPGQWYGTLIPRSYTLDHYAQALSHPLAAGSIRNSLVLAGLAVLLAVVVGFAAARLLVRSRLRGTWLLDALVMLPLAVPGIVLAFGYVAVSLRWPFAGVLEIVGPDPNPFPFLVVAYAVRRLPYVVRSAAAGLEQTSEDLEEAGRVAGAGTWRIQRRIVAPLIAANLLAGAILAFSFSMLEVSDSLLLAQREADYPITKAIYALFERLGDGPGIASAMGVWAMALLALTLFAASVLIGRRMGALFRA